MSGYSSQYVDRPNIQTGTYQQSSSTQHCDMLHGDSSVVTDQTSSQWTPNPLQGLPYHHGNQQRLQDRVPSHSNAQSNAVPHQHISPSDRTLPHSQTLSRPSDRTQTLIQQSQESYSLPANSQFAPNPPESFRTAYQQWAPNPPQGLPHEPTNQTNMYTWHHPQGMIHSGGSANSVNVTMRTVASQPASPFSETAEQISNQSQLFLHSQASQHISQTGTLQQPSSTQHHGMPHGDSSVVTDQTNSPYPHHVPPHRPPLQPTDQQLLWRRPISYPQDMPPNSRQHTIPSIETGQQQSLIQHHDYSSNLTTGHYSQGTPHPSYNHPPLLHNPHQVQPYRPPPHQTNQQSTPYPLPHPQPVPHQGVTLINPHHHYSRGTPHSHHGRRSDYRCTNQQHLQWRRISRPQALPNSMQHTFPSNGCGQSRSLIQHPNSSSNLTTGQYSQGTPQSHHNHPPLLHNPHHVQPYRPPPHQTSRQSAPYPLLHPEPAPHQGVTPQPISPHHPGYSHSPSLNTSYQRPQYHHQHQDGQQFREHSQMYWLQCMNNTSSITHLGLPRPPVKQYFPIQSGYAHMDSPAQQSLMNQSTSNQSSANLASVEPTKRHCSSTSQPTTLSANSTDSATSSSPMNLDPPDPKRARLSPHSSSTTPRALEIGLPQPDMSTLASSYISCDNSSVVGLPSSSQKHSSNQCLDVSSSNPSPPKSTFNIVYDRLFQIASKWQNLGLALGLHKSALNRIECNNSVCEDRLRETLAVRINDKPLTWRDVVNALRSVTVENNELAKKIEHEYSSQLDVQILMDSEEQSFQNITSTVINLPDCVLRYASYLKDRYKRMPVLPDTWPPPLVGKDHFTNLALIERGKHCTLPQAKSKHSIEYDYAYGNVDNIVERKQEIKLENLFKPLPGEDSTQDQFIILMDGAPGVGKTTISRKICKMWSNDKFISNFQFVILLPLRELLICSKSSTNISVADLLPADDPKLKDQIVQHVQRTSGSRILFIFDGFDELSSYQRTKHSLFLNIVKGKELIKCSVLVTSRTYASGPLEGISCINRHVEVLGFTKQQINGCVRRNISEKDKAKHLLEMLKERLDIISLCYIPLNCRIVLYVYQQQYTLPDTLTELYEVFILYTIQHYAEKISSSEDIEDQIKKANSLDSLPPVTIEQLHILLETAYTGMIENKLVFECNKIKQPKISLNFGLLNEIDLFKKDQNKHYYQFLHFTIQEFLAAKYLSLQKKFTSEYQLNFLISNIDADRFRIALLFLAGLTGLDFIPDKDVFPSELLIDLSQSPSSFSSSMFKSLKPLRTKFLYLAQLLYESKRETCEWLLSCLKSKVFDFSFHTLSQFDCLVLANFFSVTPKDHVWDGIILKNCSLKANQLELLLCKLHSRTNVPIFNSTRTLDLVHNRSGEGGRPDNISFSWLLPLISGDSKVERIYVPQFAEWENSSCQLHIPSDEFNFNNIIKELYVSSGDGCVTDTVLNR